MREWFVSSELLGLDGMPSTIEGISQKARRNNWLKRKASGQGRAYEYHISNFHHEVKLQLVEKYITNLDEANALLDLGEPSLSPTLQRKLDKDYLTLDELAKRSYANLLEKEDDEQELIEITAKTKELELLLGDRKLIEMPNIAESKLIHQLDMCPVAVYNVYAACGGGG